MRSIALLLVICVSLTAVAADVDQLLVKANLGDATAQYQLAQMYSSGNGVERDVDQAFLWFKKAARQGHVGAMYALGTAYYNGNVLGGTVTTNPSLAWVWFTLAALKGDAASAKEANRVAAEIGTLGLETGQYHMAQMLLRGDEAPQDVMRAVSLFETLAKSHCNACKLELADAYEKGIGVPIDGEKAVYWLHQAAHSSRNADIKLRLANLYLDGALVPKNLDAAKNECAGIAQTREGMMCMARVAEHRDPPDLRKAADWYKKGAEHGSFPAMIQYGRVLAEGAGVKQDYAKAYYWLSIADYASKFRETKPLLAEVTAKLSAAEIDKQKRAVDKAIAEKQIRSYEEKTGQAKGE